MNSTTYFRFLKTVPALFEDGPVDSQLEIVKEIAMTKRSMSYNEVTDLYPDADGWVPMLVCLN